MHPLNNIYHRPPAPDASPRVSFTSLKEGQTYVHIQGGIKRTVHRIEPDRIIVIRHDPDKGWYEDITPNMKGWKAMVIVTEGMRRTKARAAESAQSELIF